MFDDSCYTPECLSIGKTFVGIIELNRTNNPITCNCTLIEKMIKPIPPPIEPPPPTVQINNYIFILLIILILLI
jgi:hypothetical protein